jgi:predicted nuclease with TOPRIM domain
LRGDVADIAQKLADNGALSATLSDLLASAYGLGDALDEHKRALTRIIDEKKSLIDAEEQMLAKIDDLERRLIEERRTEYPRLKEQQRILAERLMNLSERHDYLFTPHEKQRVRSQMESTKELLAQVKEKLGRFVNE